MASRSVGTSVGPLPDFFVVGAHKAGTTAVARFLAQHDEVFVSPVKEPRHFALAADPRSFTGPDDPAARFDLHREEDYRELFAGARGEQAVGEASTIYLYHPDAAENIARAIPDARVIAILRQPVDRAYSNFLHCRRDGQEPEEDFLAALKEEGRRIGRGWGPLWHYQRKGRYAHQLARYFDHFPRESVLVLTYDDFQRDPVGFLQRIYGFLGVDDGFVPDTETRWNPGGTPRSVALQRALKLPNPLRSTMATLLPRSVKRRARHLIQRLNLRPAPELAGALRDALTRHLYAREITAIEEITGSPVPKAWRPGDEAPAPLAAVQGIPVLGPEGGAPSDGRVPGARPGRSRVP